MDLLLNAVVLDEEIPGLKIEYRFACFALDQRRNQDQARARMQRDLLRSKRHRQRNRKQYKAMRNQPRE